MKSLCQILFLSLFIVSCKDDSASNFNDNVADLERVAALENQINQLKLDHELKDSLLNESIAFFNEIQRNLSAITLKQDEIRVQTRNSEINQNDKQLILEDINYINFLRTENAKKVHVLQEKLKNSELKTNQLQEMLSRLNDQIKMKDEQIGLLQSELEQKDVEYARLFDAFHEQVLHKEEIEEIMNTVYFAYGTMKELKENNVITESKGFIGMGKKAMLKDKFNESYFSAVQIQNKKSLTLEGKNCKIITDHPTSSYELITQGNKNTLKIKDVNQFWKVSKYLVVVVD